jgi:hypothetical protein
MQTSTTEVFNGGDNADSSSTSGSTNSSSIPRLFVGMLSAARNTRKRDAVRDTWGSDARLARVVFVLARPHNHSLLAAVQREAAAHHDIILVGHSQEHYLNITHQTLEVMRAALAYQQHMRALHGGSALTHVVKTYDDTYVHIGRLLQQLADGSSQGRYTGFMYAAYKPIRNATHKWYVPHSVWSDDHPKISYAAGAGYVLTTDLVAPIALGAAVGVGCHPGPLFRFEDVSVGLWLHCLHQQHNISVTYEHVHAHMYQGCVSHMPAAFSTHCSKLKRPADEMRCMHARGGLCCDGSSLIQT